mgnify:CR=1 FL=1
MLFIRTPHLESNKSKLLGAVSLRLTLMPCELAPNSPLPTKLLRYDGLVACSLYVTTAVRFVVEAMGVARNRDTLHPPPATRLGCFARRHFTVPKPFGTIWAQAIAC